MAWVARSETITHTRVTGATATDSLDRFRCAFGLLRRELAMDNAGRDPDAMFSREEEPEADLVEF